MNRRVWDRFYQVLQELKRQGKIEDNDITTLFWHSYAEDALSSFGETETEKITPHFVLEEIEKAEKLREEATEKKIRAIEKAKEEEMEMKLKKKEQEFSESLERSISEAETRKEREWLSKIQRIKESLRESSKAKAASRSNIYTSLLALATITVIVVVVFMGLPIEILSLIIAVVGGGGLFGLLPLRSKIRNWLSERTYRQKLEEAKLEKNNNVSRE